MRRIDRLGQAVRSRVVRALELGRTLPPRWKGAPPDGAAVRRRIERAFELARLGRKLACAARGRGGTVSASEPSRTSNGECDPGGSVESPEGSENPESQPRARANPGKP